MDGMIGAVFGMLGLTIINIAVISYQYGRLNQKVVDVAERVKRLEKVQNGSA